MRTFVRIAGAVLMLAALAWSGWSVLRRYAPPAPEAVRQDREGPQARLINADGEIARQERIAQYDMVVNLALAGCVFLVGGTLLAFSFRRAAEDG